ncbi:MAG: DEAD/DEAH box helicase family protein [Spirochaetales bacterium]|nr:DEAD/DEAH box helicase family protein [Leptospiraceae bacterium]MCP5482282.1 DEAD/DEAH box helicase family protein [Spirochaetales bacterium]MCP5484279.1 DEAD/DEAH box helicase family protein [Spirochaetales bacterium]
MARAGSKATKQRKAGGSTGTKGTSHHSFARSLVLFRFILGRLGYASFDDLKRDFAPADGRTDLELAEHDIDGSRFLAVLEANGTHSMPNLALYDANIREDLARVNRHRRPPLRLKYFQYFSLLFAEYYLERFFSERDDLLSDLNEFTAADAPDADEPIAYTVDDLALLAFWNATGSGKTLLLHMNLFQMQRYAPEYFKRKPPLLITPSAEMSDQHLAELALSGIPASHYSESRRNVQLQVIEIHKIRRPQENGKKKSLDKSFWLEEFEDRNLLFVDEGHKGSSTPKAELKEEGAWREIRRILAAGGFTFEYSATFGHISTPEVRSIYERAILFDYSYRHFHGDGYGKDFHITNLEEGADLRQEEERHRYLFENLLIFLQQKLYYTLRYQLIAEYLPEDPLQIFVGHTVDPKSKPTKEDEATVSDVEKVLAFHRDVLSNKKRYQKMLKAILTGRANKDKNIRERLPFLIDTLQGDAEELYRTLLKRVFHADAPGELQICRLPGTSGEIGLRCSNSEFYYGVVNIGDAGGFLSGLDDSYKVVTPDRFAPSLFRSLQERSSQPVNVLIGARKFIEGWNNYRVSSIGLINFGRKEGTLVMQLFGRGVRLRGKDFSLKRCKEGEGPESIQILETLNVFGLNAAYMETFQRVLSREGVAHETIVVPLKVSDQMQAAILQHNLQTIRRVNEAPPFHLQPTFALKTLQEDASSGVLPGSSRSIVPRLDLRSKQKALVKDTIVQSRGGNDHLAENRKFVRSQARLGIDWDLIEGNILGFAQVKHYSNLRFERVDLQHILFDTDFEVASDQPLRAIMRGRPDRNDQIRRLVQKLLCNYVDRYYSRLQSKYEGSQVEALPLLRAASPKLDECAPLRDLLGPAHPAADGSAQVRIQVRDEDGAPHEPGERLRAAVEELFAPALKGDWTGYLKKLEAEPTPWATASPRWNIWAEFHVFQPLLVEPRKDVRSTGKQRQPELFDAITSMSPPGLVKSETDFVDHLRSYWNKNTSVHAKDSLFLLRNAGRGKGIGFYTGLFGFYPDFLLWIVHGRKTYLTFVEPHGLRLEEGGLQSPKVLLAEELPHVPVQNKPTSLVLNSFILTPTPLAQISSEITEEAAAESHVFYMDEDGEYVAALMKSILASD